MKTILHIISSPRGNASFSIRLGKAIVEKLQAAHPGSKVIERDLSKQNFPHLEESHLAGFFTPAEKRTPELIEAVRHSDEAIAQLREADIIVIGAPMYNFSIHSTLKAWIDHIVRSGETFRITGTGAEGMLQGKEVYLAMSSGFIYTEGPMKSMDFVSPYLTSMFGFLGMTDLKIIRVEGTNVPATKDTALQTAIDSITLAEEPVHG